MAIRQCPQHHFYDDEKYGVCPVCLLGARPDARERTVGCDAVLDPGSDPTIGCTMLEEDRLAKPTVGWVVCVRGRDRGRDWRLHEGRNDIGTAPDSEVLLESVGPGSGWACSIVYDGRHGRFLLVPGDGPLPDLNGRMVSGPSLLSDGDLIDVGEQRLCFQSFCGTYL